MGKYLEDLYDYGEAKSTVQEAEREIESLSEQLAKKLRSDNRQEVLAIIECLDNISQTTLYATEYGKDELRKALTC